MTEEKKGRRRRGRKGKYNNNKEGEKEMVKKKNEEVEEEEEGVRGGAFTPVRAAQIAITHLWREVQERASIQQRVCPDCRSCMGSKKETKLRSSRKRSGG